MFIISESNSNFRVAAMAANPVGTDGQMSYHLTPLFLALLRGVQGVDPAQTVFTSREVAVALSKYILARKTTLFDPGNILVARVENDPLGQVFGVATFHRDHVSMLMRNQMTPLSDELDKEGLLRDWEDAEETVTMMANMELN